jgi:cell division protein FtsW (lipid II flippase)
VISPGRTLAARNRGRELVLGCVGVVLVAGLYVLSQLAKDDALPPGSTTTLLGMVTLFGVAHLAVRRLAPNAGALFLPIAVTLTGIGYVMVSRLALASDVPSVQRQAMLQGVWIGVGVAAFVVTLALLRDYRVLDRYRYLAMVAGLALLLLPLVPGLGFSANGSRLWIQLGPVTFQPGELSKILLVVFFASYLWERRELLAIATKHIGPVGIPDFKHFGPMLAVWGVSLAVLVFERDLGSSLLVFSIFLAVLYVGTGRIAYVIAGLALFGLGAAAAYQLFDHVQTRVQGWLDPFNPETVTGPTFQLAQSLLALAAGGIFGTGVGLGHPTLIPAVSTDFVFSAIGEELGLVGATGVILLYVVFATYGIRTALRCVDPFGKMLAAGLTAAIGFQAFIIIGGVTRLIPLTGITLPFVSYGGSSILANFTILAMLVAVSDQQVSGPRGHGLVRRRALAVGRPLAEAVP